MTTPLKLQRYLLHFTYQVGALKLKSNINMIFRPSLKSNASLSSLTWVCHLWLIDITYDKSIWSEAGHKVCRTPKTKSPSLYGPSHFWTGWQKRVNKDQTQQNWQQPLFKGGQCICFRPRISAGGSWGFPLASCQVTTLYFLHMSTFDFAIQVHCWSIFCK